MFQLIAYYESVDPAGAYNALNGVPDQQAFVSGTQIRVPEWASAIIGEAGLGNDASLARMQISSPSLRAVLNIDVEPIVAALVFGNPPEGIYHPTSPIPIEEFESLEFSADSDPAAGVVHYGLIWIADGPQRPVDGRIYSLRATGAAALAAGTWVNSALTFNQTLPVGRYQVVGMRARGTNLVAARLSFVGGMARPGVVACNAIGDNDSPLQRYGRMGVFGEFHTNTPPTVDCLGVTDSAQSFIFDLIRVG